MKSRGPSPFWAWLFWASAILGTLASLFLAVTFTFGPTSYVEYFGLADPKESPGQLFGSLVAWPLTFSLAFGVYWFRRHVLSQLAAYSEASRKWDSLLEKQTALDESGKPVRLDEKAAEELVQEIARLQPPYARVVRAARSWLDPSPDSDAEMVIEGVANRCRQHLSLLQAVASVLVLIGLVGNFFGLSEAVQEMPRLAEAPKSAPQAARTPTTSIQVEGQSASATTRAADPSLSATETARESVEGIVEGLQVVVVSSVLGIGGMIGLLLFVAVFRNFFNHLVGEEVLLMATEIGTAVRPGLTPAGLGDAESLQKNLESLHLTLDTLNQRLASFEAKDRDLGKLTDQLDVTLKRHLEAEDTKFTELRKALTDLTEFLESRNETLTGVLSAAVGTGRQLESLAGSVSTLGSGLTQMVESQQKTLVDLEEYAALVRAMAREENDRREDRHRDLVDSLTGQLDKRLSDWLGRLDDQQAGFLQGNQKALDRFGQLVGQLDESLGKRLQDWLGKVDEQRNTDQKRNQESMDRVEQGLRKLVNELTGELGSQSRATREHHSELSQATEKRLAELQADWGKLAEGLLARLEQGETRASTARQEAREKLTEGLAEIEASLTREMGQLGEALSQKLPQAGEALKAVSETVQASHQELHGELKRVTELLAELSRGQGESTSSSRAVLDEAVKTLEQTRERILALQDRWNVNLEELAREIFEQWMARREPEEALVHKLGELIELQKALPETLAKLQPGPAEDRRKVCLACGLANNPEETYCRQCGESLQNAVPPGSFPVRFLAERLEALQNALQAERPAPPPPLDPALLERIEAALQDLRTDLKSRPEPEVAVAAAPTANGEPVVERLDRLIALMEEEKSQPVRRGWSFLPRRNG